MIVELRQYTLHPGTRDRFVDLFDARFVESQEALGMSVLGQLRDLDDPDRYVWLRAFPDMEVRRRALEAFYLAPAPAWRDHGPEAVAMMIDSDDVLLLRPAAGWEPPATTSRPPVGTTEDHPTEIVVTVWPGTVELAGPHLVTAHEVNDFPALPVRDEEVTVAMGPHPPVDAAPLQVLRLQPTPRSALR